MSPRLSLARSMLSLLAMLSPRTRLTMWKWLSETQIQRKPIPQPSSVHCTRNLKRARRLPRRLLLGVQAMGRLTNYWSERVNWGTYKYRAIRLNFHRKSPPSHPSTPSNTTRTPTNSPTPTTSSRSSKAANHHPNTVFSSQVD